MSESFKGLLRKIKAGTATEADHQRDQEAHMAEVRAAIRKGHAALSNPTRAGRSNSQPHPHDPHVHIGRLIAQQERERMAREDSEEPWYQAVEATRAAFASLGPSR